MKILKNNTIENVKKQFYETTAKHFNVSNMRTEDDKVIAKHNL